MELCKSLLLVAVLSAALRCNEAMRGRDITKHVSKLDIAKAVNAGQGGKASDSNSDMSFLSHAKEVLKTEASTIKNMNLLSAMAVIHKVNGSTLEFISTLEEHLGLITNSHKMLRHGRQPDGGAAAEQAAGSYNSGAWKALNMLNKMILEAIEKMDFEIVRCDSEERTNLASLAEIRADIIMFNGMAAGAATTMNKAKGDSTRFTGLLEDTKEEFKTNKNTCDVERADIEAKLKVVSGDMAVMEKVVAMTDCGDAPAVAALYQCVDTKSNRTWSEIRATGQALKNLSSQLQNPQLRKVLEGNSIFTQSSSGQAPGDNSQVAASTSKCTLGKGNCPKINEKFTDLAGEVLDSLNELKMMLQNLNLHCQQTLDGISAQIVNYDNVISETNEKLSQATKDWGTYSGQKSQKDVEENDVSKEHHDTMTACSVNIENLASEKCALKKIRGELLKMDALPTAVTDCDVGSWMENECSLPCGGGRQKLTRSLTPGELGAKCPAGAAEQSCNEDRCPVDCIMEEWSEWGSCTALCGGGIKEKARGIKVPALTKAAVQCEETAETVPCNVQACAGDCLLADWTSWSAGCSKPCGGGLMKRAKPLERAAFGTGQCPGFYDEKRFEEKACNTMACPTTKEPLTCNAKVDVILAIDGSGSMGDAGWKAVVEGAAKISRSFTGPNAKLATILFSGPTSFMFTAYCIGMVMNSENASQFDPLLNCGMTWVTRFDENQTGEAMAESIEKMTFPRGTTLTSMAIAEASAELAHGREDAESIVIVLTDGAPLSKMEASKQSEKLKKKARLMFVPVGDQFTDDEYFRSWASRPWEQNIVRVEDIEQLPSPNIVNKILLDFCDDLSYGNQSMADLMASPLDVGGGVEF